MRAVILPGMDGTGKLLAGFAARLSPDFDTDIVAYPATAASTYDELSRFVQTRIPRGGDFVLVGESFSGPLAIRLAATRPPELKGLVLCASFASSPHAWLKPLATFLSLPVPKPPTAWLMPFAMGRWATPEWSRRCDDAIATLPSSVASNRLAEVLRVDERGSLPLIACPLLYLQASHDRLVPPRCWHAIESAVPSARCVRLQGPHFILQHDPMGAAEAIKRQFIGTSFR